MNGSVVLRLSVYGVLGVHRGALAAGVLLLYVSGLCLNLLLLVVVLSTRRLHRPCYVLLLNLSVSGVLGSSAVCPSITLQLLVPRPQVALGPCLAQAFFTTVYGGAMFCLLALMAYDRYVAVCRPLLYQRLMAPQRLLLMLLAVYVLLGAMAGGQVLLASQLRLCRHSLDKLACDPLAVARLSCSSVAAVSVLGLVSAGCMVVAPCGLVLLSYTHILWVVLRSSGRSHRRALQTCTPHLLVFLNFSAASFVGLIYNRLSSVAPPGTQVLTSLLFFVFPPLLHPLIYGIKMQEIRQSLRKMMKMVTSTRSSL